VLVFPATSVAVATIGFVPAERLIPQLKVPTFKLAGVPLQVTLAMPERVSVTIPAIVCEALNDELPLLGDVIEIVGGVLSIFSVTFAVADVPALLVAVPEMTWLAPSVVTICGDGQVAIPEPASVQVKLTVTFVLFHPLAFGCGDICAEIVGGGVPGGGLLPPPLPAHPDNMHAANAKITRKGATRFKGLRSHLLA
jgi:hypothetical protein